MPSLLQELKKKFPKKKITKREIKNDKGKYKAAGVIDGTVYHSSGKELLLIPTGDELSKDAIDSLLEIFNSNDR